MDADWLQAQFEKHPGKSKAGLALLLGLEPSAVSKILNGTRQIKAKEYALMQRYFTPHDGVGGAARIGALAESEAGVQGDWMIPASVLQQKPDVVPENVRVLQLSDGSMAPDFKAGEFVLVDVSVQVPSPPGVFIVSDGYSHFARQCEMVMDGDVARVRVSARDADFGVQVVRLDDLTLIGRVIAQLNWV